MDIFTTQLTKVRQTPIKAEKLRVKGLKKDAQSRALDEEKDHLSGETQSPDLHPLAHINEDIEANEYTKQQILHPSEEHDEDKAGIATENDGDNKHIDLFI